MSFAHIPILKKINLKVKSFPSATAFSTLPIYDRIHALKTGIPNFAVSKKMTQMNWHKKFPPPQEVAQSLFGTRCERDIFHVKSLVVCWSNGLKFIFRVEFISWLGSIFSHRQKMNFMKQPIWSFYIFKSLIVPLAYLVAESCHWWLKTKNQIIFLVKLTWFIGGKVVGLQFGTKQWLKCGPTSLHLHVKLKTSLGSRFKESLTNFIGQRIFIGPLCTKHGGVFLLPVGTWTQQCPAKKTQLKLFTKYWRGKDWTYSMMENTGQTNAKTTSKSTFLATRNQDIWRHFIVVASFEVL